MKSNADNLLRLEFYTLCALAFSLPLFEGPKHIFCIIYLMLFCYRTIKHKETFKPSPLGKYILLFIATSIISSIGAAYNGYDVIKLHDIIRYSIIGWMIIHSPLSKIHLYIICAALTTSTFIACSEAYYLLYTEQKKFFELRSVGHINHSAIFILLILGSTLPLLLTQIHRKKIWGFALATNLTITFFLFETNSRATFIGLLLIFIIFIISTAIKHKNHIPLILISCSILAGIITINPPNVVNKIIQKHNYYSERATPREKSWNTTYHAWKKEIIFGVGYGNYRVITPKKMSEWYKDTGVDVTNKKHFIYLPHAHNRYMNTLAEGGLIGLLGLLVLFGAIIYHLFINSRHSFIEKDSIYFWLIGANTLSTITIVGLFNTTLHHEHGLLAMMLIGISFSYLHNNKNEVQTKPQNQRKAS